MNLNFSRHLRRIANGAVVIAAAALTACTSPIESRITKNPQLYQNLSARDQVLVRNGEIREGMTREGVFLAMGHPDQVFAGREAGSAIERWSYVGTRPVATSSIGIGWGTTAGYGYGLGNGFGGVWDPLWGRYGAISAPSVAYVPYQSDQVEFRHGKVYRYLREPGRY